MSFLQHWEGLLFVRAQQTPESTSTFWKIRHPKLSAESSFQSWSLYFMKIKSSSDSKQILILRALSLIPTPAEEPNPQKPDLLLQSTQSIPGQGLSLRNGECCGKFKRLTFFLNTWGRSSRREQTVHDRVGLPMCWKPSAVERQRCKGVKACALSQLKCIFFLWCIQAWEASAFSDSSSLPIFIARDKQSSLAVEK